MGKWIDNWFSNYARLDEPFRFSDGLEFWTVENFFQAMKTTDFELRKKIAAMTPGEAKKFCSARENNFPLRSGWQHLRIQVMEFALRKKFAPNSKWAEQLLATGDEEIIEFNNWHDCTWGHCVCKNCEAKYKRNLLGKLLITIREDLRS